MRVAVTRPSSEGERTAAALRAKGHDALLAPLMEVETIAANLDGDWSGVIMTSANAARALNDAQKTKLEPLPVFVVGRRTAEAARDSGFTQVTSADGDGSNLADLIAAHCKDRHAALLYLAGENRAFDLEGELHRKGVAAKTVVVYRAVTVPFPQPLIDALRNGQIDAVLHFSRLSAANYVSGARAAGIVEQALSLAHLCLSAQVAEPLNTAGAKTRVATHPNEGALLDMLESR
ncbi:MAG: uroporphyrinogen-III synthase [Pseudolabrys sp.]|nr:uroporphyrinogen-III synthase [Pseudolabrys sp.]